MLRPEILIAGCILVLLGVGLIVFGYQSSQPTTTDYMVAALESLSGEEAPPELKRSRTVIYASYLGGLVMLCGGFFMILKSRSTT